MPTLARSSRRALLAALAATALPRGVAPTLAQTPAAPTDTGSFPRTVVDARGEAAVIPARPRAVYTGRNFTEYDTILALGVTPVGWGTFPGRALQPYQVAAGGEENGIDVTDGADLETLLARSVDLIVVSEDLLEVAADEVTAYQQLGVPFVALPVTSGAEQLRVAGAVLGREAEAAARLAEFDARRATFAPAIVPASLSVLLMFDASQFQRYTPTSTAGIALAALGLPPPCHPTGAGSRRAFGPRHGVAGTRDRYRRRMADRSRFRRVAPVNA